MQGYTRKDKRRSERAQRSAHARSHAHAPQIDTRPKPKSVKVGLASNQRTEGTS